MKFNFFLMVIKLHHFFRAAINNKLEMVKILLEKGADSKIANNNNATPLYMAVCKNNFEMVKILFRKRCESRDCQ